MLKVQKDEWHSGFQMTFENGWTVSVQFGRGNYCANRSTKWPFGQEEIYKSSDAEVAAWDEQGVWYQFDGDSVKGWCKSDEVADFISKIKGL